MTIADKLLYLEETKDLLRESINNYSSSLTEDTPFREYVDAVDNIVFNASGGISSLFDGGEEGFCFGELPYYQDVNGTTKAGWGDPVGRIPDATQNARNLTQATVTARPILRNDPPRLEFDLVDDLLQTTLPTITNGTLVLAGTNGIWIDDDFNHAGGAFTVGPTTYTGGPAGILGVVGDLIVGGSFAIDRQLTAQERERVINKLKSMGAPGVFELGPELVVNGTFDTDISGWIYNGSSGSMAWQEPHQIVATRETDDPSGPFTRISVEAGHGYLASVEVVNTGAGVVGQCWLNSGQGPAATNGMAVGANVTGPGKSLAIFTPSSVSAVMYLRRSGASGSAAFDNASLRKLELVP